MKRSRGSSPTVREGSIVDSGYSRPICVHHIDFRIAGPCAHESDLDCLANAYLELGQLDEAIAEYERILRLNPNYPLAYYHLAKAYERKGHKEEARAAYERFLQVWKDADGDLPEVINAKRYLAVPS